MENEIYQKGKERNKSDIKRQKKKIEVKIKEKQETYIWLTD